MSESSPASKAAPDLPAGFSELAGGYDLVLCDLWGVMHDGRKAFAAAGEAMTRFRAGGGTVVMITNAPRPREPILQQLASLGVPSEAFDAIVTSGDVTIAAIAEQGQRPIYHIGPERDLALFRSVERRAGVSPVLTSLEEAEIVVVTGLRDDRRETPDDYRDALVAMRARDLPMICANPDIVVHVGDRLIYCGGALADAYAKIGGRTNLAGKTHPPIYAAALAKAAEIRGGDLARDRVLAIGDGLKTDVLGAAHQGLDVLFITTGIHRDELHPEQDGAPDLIAYAERLSTVEHPLRAAMPRLAW